MGELIFRSLPLSNISTDMITSLLICFLSRLTSSIAHFVPCLSNRSVFSKMSWLTVHFQGFCQYSPVSFGNFARISWFSRFSDFTMSFEVLNRWHSLLSDILTALPSFSGLSILPSFNLSSLLNMSDTELPLSNTTLHVRDDLSFFILSNFVICLILPDGIPFVAVVVWCFFECILVRMLSHNGIN